MITHLDTAELTDLADDRVEIHGVRGSPPPVTTKVAITGIGGWENSAVFALTGTDLDAKAALVERSVRRYADAVGGIDAVALDRIGKAQHDPDNQDAASELLRIAVQGTEQAAGRAFSSRMIELALSSYPGLYALGPPQPGSAFGVYWPALLDQSFLEHTVHHHDGSAEIVVPATAPDAEGAVSPPAEHWRAPSAWASTPGCDELVVVSLGELVHARCGDKGGDANLGVWVRDRAAQGLAHVDSQRRGAATPATRNTPTGDLALQAPQPGRGQLRAPRTARNRRHLDPAAGLTGKSARRMAALAQHQGARALVEAAPTGPQLRPQRSSPTALQPSRRPQRQAD